MTRSFFILLLLTTHSLSFSANQGWNGFGGCLTFAKEQDTNVTSYSIWKGFDIDLKRAFSPSASPILDPVKPDTDSIDRNSPISVSSRTSSSQTKEVATNNPKESNNLIRIKKLLTRYYDNKNPHNRRFTLDLKLFSKQVTRLPQQELEDLLEYHKSNYSDFRVYSKILKVLNQKKDPFKKYNDAARELLNTPSETTIQQSNPYALLGDEEDNDFKKDIKSIIGTQGGIHQMVVKYNIDHSVVIAAIKIVEKEQQQFYSSLNLA